MDNDNRQRYEILRQLALAGARGEALKTAVGNALRQAAALVDVTASALYLWDGEMTVTLTVSHADSEAGGQRLEELEKELFVRLRREQKLLAAYMTFGGEPILHSFTLPLRHGREVFGAVIGIGEGEHSLAAQHAFLETLSAAVTLNVVADGAFREGEAGRAALDKERLDAIVEMAVTVNHEINNPLTAILGNVQLLLMKRGDLDEDLQKKLVTIEDAAMKIRDVTQKMLRMKSVEYAEGTEMLDLSEEDSDESGT
jgi:signal transduction histidine kinase